MPALSGADHVPTHSYQSPDELAQTAIDAGDIQTALEYIGRRYPAQNAPFCTGSYRGKTPLQIALETKQDALFWNLIGRLPENELSQCELTVGQRIQATFACGDNDSCLRLIERSTEPHVAFTEGPYRGVTPAQLASAIGAIELICSLVNPQGLSEEAVSFLESGISGSPAPGAALPASQSVPPFEGVVGDGGLNGAALVNPRNNLPKLGQFLLGDFELHPYGKVNPLDMFSLRLGVDDPRVNKLQVPLLRHADGANQQTRVVGLLLLEEVYAIYAKANAQQDWSEGDSCVWRQIAEFNYNGYPDCVSEKFLMEFKALLKEVSPPASQNRGEQQAIAQSQLPTLKRLSSQPDLVAWANAFARIQIAEQATAKTTWAQLQELIAQFEVLLTPIKPATVQAKSNSIWSIWSTQSQPKAAPNPQLREARVQALKRITGVIRKLSKEEQKALVERTLLAPDSPYCLLWENHIKRRYVEKFKDIRTWAVRAMAATSRAPVFNDLWVDTKELKKLRDDLFSGIKELEKLRDDLFAGIQELEKLRVEDEVVKLTHQTFGTVPDYELPLRPANWDDLRLHSRLAQCMGESLQESTVEIGMAAEVCRRLACIVDSARVPVVGGCALS